MLVGNDIVDLLAPGAREKHLDRRFLARVFSPEEQSLIASAVDPATALWVIWSAKEAAFKVVSKLRRGTVFSHRKFRVSSDRGGGSRTAPTIAPTGCCRQHNHSSGEPAQSHFTGGVTYGGLMVLCEWACTPDYVHCVGHVDSGDEGIREIHHLVASAEDGSLVVASESDCLSPRERPSVHSPESAAARRLAKDLLRNHGVSEPEVVREQATDGWEPPRVLSRGQLMECIDLSLSHDGRFIAAVVSVSAVAAAPLDDTMLATTTLRPAR